MTNSPKPRCVHAAAALLLLLPLSGCTFLGREASQSHASLGESMATRFEAGYERPDSSLPMLLSLGDARPILGRDGVSRNATPLTLTEGPFNQVFWLGRDGRIVRHDEFGQGIVPSVDWRSRGLLPPLGIGWLLAVHDGRLVMNKNDPSRQAHAIWQSEERRLNVTFDGSRVVTSPLDSPGDYFYDAAFLPLHMLIPDGPRDPPFVINRTSFQVLGPQARTADDWPEESWETPPVGPDEIPGAREKTGPWRHPLQGFLDALRANATARQDWTGCLGSAMLMMPSNQTVQAGPIPVQLWQSEMAWITLKSATGNVTLWRVRGDNFMALDKYTVVPPEPWRRKHACEGAYQAQVDWPTGWRLARPFFPDDLTIDLEYAVTHPSYSWDAKVTPATYTVMATADGGGLVWMAQISATDGRPEWFGMPQEFLDRALGVLAQSAH